MAWIAVDADGTAYKYNKKPIRATDCWMPDHSDTSTCVAIPMATVKTIIGKNMNWSDQPVEIEVK